MQKPSHTTPQEELHKELKVFQDAVASWGYPMNQEGQVNALAVFEERIGGLIEAEASRREQAARIASVQLYMDTCEEYGVDPSWQSIHEFQDGQRQALKEGENPKEVICP